MLGVEHLLRAPAIQISVSFISMYVWLMYLSPDQIFHCQQMKLLSLVSIVYKIVLKKKKKKRGKISYGL